MNKPRIFICYRRKGGSELAQIIRQALQPDFTPYLDTTHLEGGPYDEQLLKEIESADGFVLILSRNSLNRCGQKGDWVATEVAHAVKHGKNIVPVVADGFRWPAHLPKEIASLTKYQAVNYSPLYHKERIKQLKANLKKRLASGVIFAIGSGNLENLMDCGAQRVTLGEKHEVTMEPLWGGSAVNFSSRLLAAGLPVIPILAVGNDASGNLIREALQRSAISGKAPQGIQSYLDAQQMLMGHVRTPTSTIVVHGRERTIFRPELQADEGFNEAFKLRIKSVMASYKSTPTSIILGHIPTESEKKVGRRKAGLCSKFILEHAPDHALVYGVLGSTQLALPWKQWDSALRRIDVFQCNMEEAIKFFPAKNGRPSLDQILDLLRARKMSAVLTMDRFGAIAVYRGTDSIYIAWPLIKSEDVVDSTGAGDAFAAGMMSILHLIPEMRNFTQEQFGRALHEGSIWAASACTTRGGCGTDPRAELDRFRRTHPDVEQRKAEIRLREHAKEIINFIDMAYH